MFDSLMTILTKFSTRYTSCFGENGNKALYIQQPMYLIITRYSLCFHQVKKKGNPLYFEPLPTISFLQTGLR